MHTGFLFLDPEDAESLRLGAIWNYSKGMGLPGFDMRLWGTEGPFKGLHASEPKVLKLNYYSHTYCNGYRIITIQINP